MPRSSTSTSTPARANHQPALRPVTPPPMITTDAPFASLTARPSWSMSGRLDKARLQRGELRRRDMTRDPMLALEALHRRRRVVADRTDLARAARGERTTARHFARAGDGAFEYHARAGTLR